MVSLGVILVEKWVFQLELFLLLFREDVVEDGLELLHRNLRVLDPLGLALLEGSGQPQILMFLGLEFIEGVHNLAHRLVQSSHLLDDCVVLG